MRQTKFGRMTIGGGGGAAQAITVQMVQIVDGNLISDVSCIKSITPENANSGLTYDISGGPNGIDFQNTLPDGYGRGWLYKFTMPLSSSDGLQTTDNGQTGRVLIQNSNPEVGSIPLLAGSTFYVGETISISGAGGIYTAYIPRTY
jgi:hypothetical protein